MPTNRSTLGEANPGYREALQTGNAKSDGVCGAQSA